MPPPISRFCWEYSKLDKVVSLLFSKISKAALICKYDKTQCSSRYTLLEMGPERPSIPLDLRVVYILEVN